MGLERLRIFISSPGDVAEERVIANRVVRRLSDEFAHLLWVEPVFWEHEPLLAHDTFQSQIPRPSETKIVICILWSRLGTRLPAGITRPDGTRYASGTEYEFEDAVEARKKTGQPDMLCYRKTSDPVVSLKDTKALLERVSQKEGLEAFIRRWFFDEADGTLKAAFHQFDKTSEFELIVEEHLRRLIMRRIDQLPAAAVAAPPARSSWTAGSPFRGLEVFDFEHAPVFFGRTRAVGDVLNALRQNAAAGKAFVLVVGVSGGGKSSLVRAGVLPVLTQPGVIEGIGLWRRAVMRPGESPDDLFLGLAGALLKPEALPELAADGTTAEQLAQMLRDSPTAAGVLMKGGLSQAAAQLAAAQKLDRQPESRLVVVVDQMEEIFTLEKVGPAERAAFVAALSALSRSLRVWVIGTLRSDFYPRCAELPELMALKEGSGQYDVALPTPTEIGQTIRRPAAAAGLRFEEDPETKTPLDDVLRDAAAGHPESLPLLEFALEELYKQRTASGLLTHAAYRRLGGVEGALAKRAEEVYSALPADVRAALPRVFRALVNVGETEAVARRQATLATTASTPAAATLVEAFVKARLLIAGAADDGTAVVQVAHEALLRNWPRVRDWLEHDRELLRMRARVAAACARWEQDGRTADLLLSEGKPLEEARLVVRSLGSELSPAQDEFVAASAARARRRVRAKRMAVAALVLLSVAATAAAVVAERSRAEAGRQQRFAQEQRARAERNAVIAGDQRKLALDTVHDLIFAVQDKLKKPGLLEVRKSILGMALDRLKGIERSAAASPGEDADRDAGAADMRLGDVFLLLGQTTDALAVYRHGHDIFARLAAAHGDTAAQRDLAVSLNKLGDATLMQGDAAAARDQYEQGLKIAEPLAAATPQDVQAQRDLSISHHRLGDVLQRLGNLQAAQTHYAASLAIARAMAAAHPGDDTVRRDLAVAYNRSGDVCLQRGDTAGARENYTSSLNIARPLAAAAPTDPQAQGDLLFCYEALAEVDLLTGDTAAAVEQYGRALPIAQSIAAADPDNAESRRGLTVVYTKLGDVKYRRGDAAGAGEEYARSLQILEALCDADPANAHLQRDLYGAYDNLGDVRLRLGDAAGAKANFQAALELRQARAAAAPDDAQAQRDLGVSYTALGDVKLQLGDVTGAKEDYARGLKICQALAAKDPASAVAKRDLSVAYQRSGDLSLQTGDRAAAAAAYTANLEIARGLAEADPANAQARRDLSVSYNSVGNVSMLAGDAAAAKGVYTKALAIARALSAADPTRAEVQRDLRICLSKVAEANLLAGDAAVAKGLFTEALKVLQASLAGAPNDPQGDNALAYAYDQLGEVNQQLGDLAAAKESFEQSLLRREALAGRQPGEPGAMRNQLVAENKLAVLATRANNPAAAKAHYAVCVKIMLSLVAAEPADAASRRSLAVYYNNLGDVLLACGDASAERQYAAALEIAKELAAAVPVTLLARTDLAYCDYEMGRAAESAKRASDAIRFYEQGLEILVPLRASGELENAPAYGRLIDLLKTRIEACRLPAATQPAATRPAVTQPAGGSAASTGPRGR